MKHMDQLVEHVRPEALIFGERARLGFIDLSTSVVMSAELPRALPPGVGAITTRIRLPNGDVSAHALKQMVDSKRLEEAALELADADVDVVVFGCTTGSLLGGPGFDEQLIQRMESAAGVRATTTSTALIEGLRAVRGKRLGVGTPYIDELNTLEAEFLEGAGFDIVSLQGLSIESDGDIARVPYDTIRELARSVERGADTIFLSCANLPTLEILEELEQELDRPVVSSVAVTIWHALKLAGIEAGAGGVGSLLAGQYAAR